MESGDCPPPFPQEPPPFQSSARNRLFLRKFAQQGYNETYGDGKRVIGIEHLAKVMHNNPQLQFLDCLLQPYAPEGPRPVAPMPEDPVASWPPTTAASVLGGLPPEASFEV